MGQATPPKTERNKKVVADYKPFVNDEVDMISLANKYQISSTAIYNIWKRNGLLPQKRSS